MKLSIDIPTSLKDITLKQYKHYLKVEKNNKDDVFLQAKMIEIFCNVSLKKVMKLRLKDTKEVVKILSKLFETKSQLVKTFKLNKIEYGFHPQLDDLSLGEYIDLDTYIGDWDAIEKAMNVLYRPVIAKVKDKYTVDEYKLGNEIELLNMPMDAVMSSIFFLWNLGLDLSKVMTNSLDKNQTQILTDYLCSEGNGVGINQFMDSLSVTLRDLKISLN
tara:strand:+ start:4240 stop:4890 length:651 start_codon:yes stop_codon:yes gene_type:complete